MKKLLLPLYVVGGIVLMLHTTEQVFPGWTIVTYTNQLKQLGLDVPALQDKAANWIMGDTLETERRYREASY